MIEDFRTSKCCETNKINLNFNSKFIQTKGLIHYWPFNSNVNDIVGLSHLVNGINASLSNDRFNKPLSSLCLKTGYYKLPSGIYFPNSNFTIAAWANVNKFNKWSRLIQFADGNDSRNAIDISFTNYTYGFPSFSIRNQSNQFRVISPAPLTKNNWFYIACTYEYPYLSLYLDGILMISLRSPIYILNIDKTRSFVYIGRSWNEQNGDMNADAKIDELKIFNRALTNEEILFEMNNEIFI